MHWLAKWDFVRLLDFDIVCIFGNIKILTLSYTFDFSCMVTIDVDIVYNQIVRGSIMKTQKVDRSV